MWQAWWVWIVAGLAIGALELLVPGYVFLGFMVGAILTGVLVGLGVPGSFPVAVALFALLSLAAWVALRRLFGKTGADVKTFDRDINDG
jgi:inner membrane protein